MSLLSSQETWQIFLMLTTGTITNFFSFRPVLFLHSLVEAITSLPLEFLPFSPLLPENSFEPNLWLFSSEFLFPFSSDFLTSRPCSFQLKALNMAKLSSRCLRIWLITYENLLVFSLISVVHSLQISITLSMIELSHFYRSLLLCTCRLNCTKLLAKFQLIHAFPVVFELQPIIYLLIMKYPNFCERLQMAQKIQVKSWTCCSSSKLNLVLFSYSLCICSAQMTNLQFSSYLFLQSVAMQLASSSLRYCISWISTVIRLVFLLLRHSQIRLSRLNSSGSRCSSTYFSTVYLVFLLCRISLQLFLERMVHSWRSEKREGDQLPIVYNYFYLNATATTKAKPFPRAMVPIGLCFLQMSKPPS